MRSTTAYNPNLNHYTGPTAGSSSFTSRDNMTRVEWYITTTNVTNAAQFTFSSAAFIANTDNDLSSVFSCVLVGPSYPDDQCYYNFMDDDYH